MSASDLTKRYVWVRAGGRCIICNESLLLKHLDDGDAVRQIGEVAHIAGESEKGPRGDSEVPVDERNDPSNLVLLCPNDHRGADKLRLEDPLFTEDFLRRRKGLHEGFVEHVTSLRDERATTVLRMAGMIRDRPGNVSREEAATVVMNHALRIPRHRADPYGIGDEIDLTVLDETADAGYWDAGLRIIDKVVDRLQRDVADDGTDHVSVFAIALVPLLVALGNRIDDTVALDVYERHRSSDSWAWNDEAPVTSFEVAPMPEVPDCTAEAVLLVNASGTVQADELPAELQSLPVFTIEPVAGSAPPSTATFESSATLASFGEALIGFFASLETQPSTKSIRRLHLFAAVPVSAAVTIGRRLAVDNAAPQLALYHRTDNSYLHTFNIPTPWTPP